MRRLLPLLGLLLLAISVTSLDRQSPDGRIYGEYDREFRAYLAKAAGHVGKETIRVERLSGRFTVPKRLTVKSTPYEIGLTIGHVGRQAGARPPLLGDGDRALNQKFTELYRRVYPQQLGLVRGVADMAAIGRATPEIKAFFEPTK
jgi:hypothetical protein